MGEINTAQVLGKAQKGFQKEFQGLLTPLVDQARGRLIQLAGGENNPIDKRQRGAAVKAIGEPFQRLFVGPDMRSAFADDGVTALAPYPLALNKWYAYTVAETVRASGASMRKMLKDETVIRWLENAQPPAGASVGEFLKDNLIHRVLHQYDPMHLFVDPAGYRLSDNVWRTSADVREKIDLITGSGIDRGEGALRIARLIEQDLSLLQPNERNRRTTRPYNTRVNYSAMRLARTEITAASGRAIMLSGRLNPFVTGIRWNLSPQHPKTDRCDVHAQRSPYALDKVPRYPDHPHCMCNLTQIMTDSPEAITNRFRAYMEAGNPAPLTPVAANPLILLVLGAYLFGLLDQLGASV